MDWTVMQWLEAGGYVVAIVGGIAGGCVFIARKLRRFAKFSYPAQGEAGPNLLAPGVGQVTVGQHVALSAVVPGESMLLVSFRGEPEPDPPAGSLIGGIGGAWFYSIAPGPLNWRGNHYRGGDSTVGPTQTFTARGGPAELDMHFGRPGSVVLEVHERGSPSPTWTKIIRIVPARD